MTVIIKPPYELFSDVDGSPLEAGDIFIGSVGNDAESNPITIYWDRALTQAASQPIKTIAGAPSNNGTPSLLFAATGYSITVKNKNGTIVYTTLDSERPTNNSSEISHTPADILHRLNNKHYLYHHHTSFRLQR